MEGNDGQFTDRDVANAIDKRHEQCRVRITALETALAAMTAERDYQAKLADDRGDAMVALNDARVEAADAVLNLTAERDARDVAIGVLAGECFEWRLAHVCSPVSLIDAPIIRARKRTMENPIARAAVEGER